MKLLIIDVRLDERNCIYFEYMMGAKALVRRYMCVYITKFRLTFQNISRRKSAYKNVPLIYLSELKTYLFALHHNIRPCQFCNK